MSLRLDPTKDSGLIRSLIQKGLLREESLVTQKTGPKRTLPAPKLTGKQVTELILTLPLPPSVNEMHGKRQDGTIGHTKTWRQYKKTVHCAALLKKVGWIDGKIEASAKFYFPSEASDLDNRLKALFDALQGVCFVNDRQIRRLRDVEALVDRANPRVEVELREYLQEG